MAIEATGSRLISDYAAGDNESAVGHGKAHAVGTVTNFPLVNLLIGLHDFDPKNLHKQLAPQLERFRENYRKDLAEQFRPSFDNGTAAAPLTEQVVLIIVLLPLSMTAAEAEAIAAEAKVAPIGRGWQHASLRDALGRHAGENYTSWATKTGKIIFETSNTGRQIVVDIEGQYFRIFQPKAIGS